MRVKLLGASALMVFLGVPAFAQNPAAGPQCIRGRSNRSMSQHWWSRRTTGNRFRSWFRLS